ncbi:MAG: DUF4097 domain-containing protein [Phycisphaerales bacterium JB050]
MNQHLIRSASVVTLLTLLPASAIGLVGCASSYSTIEGQRSASMPITDSSVISVQSVNGDIQVVRGDDLTLSVEATIRARDEERLNATQIVTNHEADGSYSVSIAWPNNKRLNDEGADFFITLPGVSELKLQSSNGAFRIENLDAAVHARTTNGSIRIIGPSRSIDAATSNGAIQLEGTVGPVTARSSNGRIRLLLAPENTGPVVLSTSNGNITLGVGPAFSGDLAMTTSNGELNAKGFSSEHSPIHIESSRNSLRLGFGEAAHKSSLRTSNGTVTVQPL